MEDFDHSIVIVQIIIIITILYGVVGTRGALQREPTERKSRPRSRRQSTSKPRIRRSPRERRQPTSEQGLDQLDPVRGRRCRWDRAAKEFERGDEQGRGASS